MRPPTGTAPAPVQVYPASSASPVQTSTPSSVELAVQRPVTFPAYASSAYTSSCAAARSSADGATPARCSPPLNVAVIAEEGPELVHTATPLTLVFRHAETPDKLALAIQPLLTVPLGQSVQVDVLPTHAPPTRPPA